MQHDHLFRIESTLSQTVAYCVWDESMRVSVQPGHNDGKIAIGALWEKYTDEIIQHIQDMSHAEPLDDNHHAKVFYIYDKAFAASHVVIAHKQIEVTLTTEQALNLGAWLGKEHDNLVAKEAEKIRQRSYLESED